MMIARVRTLIIDKYSAFVCINSKKNYSCVAHSGFNREIRYQY